jgi:hypothetical protein
MAVATRGWAGVLVAGFAAAAVACGTDDSTETGGPSALEVATVELTGAQEVPMVRTGATGQATATLSGNLLRVTGSFQGLESDLFPVAGSPAHVHEAPPGVAGPVVFNLEVTPGADNRSGTFEGEMLLDMDQLRSLQAGDYYVNVHTANNRSGEIRGQLIDPPVQPPENLEVPSPPPEPGENPVRGSGAPRPIGQEPPPPIPPVTPPPAG